jgi:hypothetical protein
MRASDKEKPIMESVQAAIIYYSATAAALKVGRAA